MQPELSHKEAFKEAARNWGVSDANPQKRQALEGGPSALPPPVEGEGEGGDMGIGGAVEDGEDGAAADDLLKSGVDDEPGALGEGVAADAPALAEQNDSLPPADDSAPVEQGAPAEPAAEPAAEAPVPMPEPVAEPVAAPVTEPKPEEVPEAAGGEGVGGGLGEDDGDDDDAF